MIKALRAAAATPTTFTAFTLRKGDAVYLDPCTAMRVVIGQEVGRADGVHFQCVHGVHDRGGHARRNRHGQERGIYTVAIGQAEADVRRATSGVHTQLVA